MRYVICSLFLNFNESVVSNKLLLHVKTIFHLIWEKQKKERCSTVICTVEYHFISTDIIRHENLQTYGMFYVKYLQLSNASALVISVQPLLDFGANHDAIDNSVRNLLRSNSVRWRHLDTSVVELLSVVPFASSISLLPTYGKHDCVRHLRCHDNVFDGREVGAYLAGNKGNASPSSVHSTQWNPPVSYYIR